MVEETGTARDGVAIAFYEVEKESYARGGVLISDK
jgi:phenylpyruvate tautomerase PptA (4-oxalocrotonate tautomerase family)